MPIDIFAIPKTIFSKIYHDEKKNSSNLTDRIRTIAKETLTEATVLLTMSSVASFFVSVSVGALGLIVITISVIATNFFIRYFSNTESLSETQNLCSFHFAMIDCTTRDALTHEIGHAIAVRCFFKTPISIELYPFIGACTYFESEKLTRLGKKIKIETIFAIIAACGPAAAILFAVVFLVLSKLLLSSYQQISTYFSSVAYMSLISHFLYAITALFSDFEDFSHDFVCLWLAGGIHPLISALLILLIPIVSLSIFYKIQNPSLSFCDIVSKFFEKQNN